MLVLFRYLEEVLFKIILVISTRLYLVVFILFYFSGLKATDKDIKYNNYEVTSLWLSHSYNINPLNKSRFTFHANFCSAANKNIIYYYPDIAFGLKVSKNLSLTTNIFIDNLNDSSSRIVGVGAQYFFGSKDTLDWVTSIKRVDIKVLKLFYLSNIAFDISRWFQYKKMFFKLGLGTNFFKKNYYLSNINRLSNTTGQVNFLFSSMSFPFYDFNLGTELKFSNNKLLFSLLVNTEFY